MAEDQLDPSHATRSVSGPADTSNQARGHLSLVRHRQRHGADRRRRHGRSGGRRSAQDVMTRMADRFEQIKQTLEAAVRQDSTLVGMGTTMTLVANFRADLLVAHVGDSRAYLFRQGQLERLTRDQTIVQRLLEQGSISPEEVARHPMRHLLSGVIGTKGKPIDVELRFLGLEDRDQILVCSDGLTEMVAEAAIAATLAAAPTAESACRQLVDLANRHGGKDNVTVVVSRYQIAPVVS